MTQSASEITVTPARDYGNEVGQGWPGVVAPAPGELLSSCLHRLAMANGIPPQYFGRVLDIVGGDWSEKLDRDLPGRTLSLLVERTGLRGEDIDGLALNRDPLAGLRLRQIIGSGSARTSASSINRLQYCPVCLKEDHEYYFRRGWTLATRVSCFRHGCRLRDHCPTCGGASRLLDKTGFCRNISASGVMPISKNPPCPPSMMCSDSNGSSTICYESMLRDMDGMERHPCPPCLGRLVSRSMASRRQFRACRTGSATYCSASLRME